MNYIIIGQRNNGELEKLERYLNAKNKTFLSVGFDSYLQSKNSIKIEKFCNGKSINTKISYFFYFKSNNKLITLANFLILFLSIIFKIKKEKNTIAIGISLFPTLICYTLKLQRKIKNFVYYNQDYYLPEKNISSKIYCKIFEILDNFLYLNCFKAWNSSIRLDNFRKKIPIEKKIGKTLILTNGFFYDFDETSTYDENSKSICFVGSLTENQKIYTLIDTVKKLNHNNNQYKLDIIGMGPLYESIKSRINKQKINSFVRVHGFIDDLHLLRTMISKSVMCYCVYKKEKNDNSSIASVGKLSLYTSIRRPCILSDHLVLSKYYKHFNCGVLTNSSDDDIFTKIQHFLNNKELRIKMQKNLNKIRPIWVTERRYGKAFNILEGDLY